MSDLFIPIKIVPMKAEHKKTDTMAASKYLLDRLGIDKKHHFQIGLGKKIMNVSVDCMEIAHNEIHLTESLFQKFSLPIHSYKLLGKYISAKQQLYLGPIIALLTDIILKKDETPHFRSIHSFCEELDQRTTEIGGLFYVFHYRDFSDEVVNGYYYENNQWNLAKLPLPDVIYNRVHSRKKEHQPSFKSFRLKLEQMGIPLFNDRFLSKWEVYQHLMLEEKIHPHMPETHILSQESLDDFLNKYDTIFIKPVHGSQGRNIIKLTKQKESILISSSQDPASGTATLLISDNELSHYLKQHLHNKIYIIQQGISLINHQGRPIDFRVLVHKNQSDLWEVTSLVARISAQEQFVSNLAKGGTMMKPTTALQSSFPQKTSFELVLEMKELSVLAADIISTNSTGITGELGIDIGVDDIGKPWIIEVNSKPSKNSEDTLTKIRPSTKAIIQFCHKLAFDGVSEMEEM